MVPDVEGTQFWTFEAVQERLVEAMLLWRRMPDRERGWLAVKAYWPDLRRHNHFGDYADAEATPRPLPLSRAEIRRMERSEEHTSELQSLMRNSYAVFCLKKTT